jgi:hypothetical protein
LSHRARRIALLLALAALYLAHNDLWLWNDPSLVLGLPVGLTYHVAYCFAAAGLMALLVRFAWPEEAADAGSEDGKTGA